MIPLKLERWKSSDNQEETHYFLANNQKVYVMGFNPIYIPEKVIREFLAERGFHVENCTD